MRFIMRFIMRFARFACVAGLLLSLACLGRGTAHEPEGFDPDEALSDQGSTAGGTWLLDRIGFLGNVGQCPDSVLFVARTEAGDCALTRDGLVVAPDSAGRSHFVAFGAQVGAWRPLGRDSCLVSAFIGDRPEHWLRGVPAYPSLISAPTPSGPRLICAVVEGALFIATDDTTTLRRMESSAAASGSMPPSLHLLRLEGPQPLPACPDEGTARALFKAFKAQARIGGAPVSSMRSASGDGSSELTSAGGTFLGGTHGDDQILGIARAANGDILVAGQTSSVFFPGTSGGWQPQRDSSTDWFVARLSPELGTLRSATYLGGSAADVMHDGAIECFHEGGLTLLSNGDVLLFGGTQSADFPCTGGGCVRKGLDVAIARLSGSLTELHAAAHFGGTRSDHLTQVIELPGRGLLGCGLTNSAAINDPAFDGEYSAGGIETMIMAFDESLNVTRGVLIGGSADEISESIAAAGNTAWVAVDTRSTVLHGLDRVEGSPGGQKDAMLIEFDLDTFTARRGLRYGSTGNEYVRDVILDSSGQPLLLLGSTSDRLPGATYSTRSPYTAMRGKRSGIARYSGAGTWKAHLLASTDDVDLVRLTRLPGGAIAAAGYVEEGDDAFVLNALQPNSLNGGRRRTGYVAVFDETDLEVLTATLFGGAKLDLLSTACTDPSGDVLVAGWTTSLTHPGDGSWSPYQPSYSESATSSRYDGIIARLTYSGGTGANTPEILSVLPTRAARATSVTVSIHGRLLEAVDTWCVHDAQGRRITAPAGTGTDSDASATFDLSLAALGSADLAGEIEGTEVARLTDALELIDDPCEAPRLFVLGETRMRGGDWRRPNVISILIENPCGADIAPQTPVTITVTPGNTEVRSVSPLAPPPAHAWPVDIAGEPLIVGDSDGAIISLFPPPIPAGGSAEWTGQFQVPEPPPGAPRSREMTVRAEWYAQQTVGCLQALEGRLARNIIFDRLTAIFGPCASDLIKAIDKGRTAIAETHNRDRRFINDLGFIISAAKATASCSAVPLIRVIAMFARLESAAATASQIVAYGRITAACGPVLGAGLAAALGYSFDPNEILGPSGGGSRNAIAQGDSLVYTVLFENAPSADAPATDATIEIPLDPGVFDASSLRPIEFGFGSQTASVEDLELGDTLQVADESHPDLVVLCVIEMDTDAHKVVCRLMTREAEDLSMPPFDGFLPPNDETGRGEGFVRFRIDGASGLAAGTTISAQATITFDLNPPIVTNTWANLLDPEPPWASVSVAGVGGTGLERVAWSAEDEGSGIRTAVLIGETDTGDARLLAIAAGPGEYQLRPNDTDIVSVTVAAQDSAGNWSDVATQGDFGAARAAGHPVEVFCAMPDPARTEAIWLARVARAGSGRATVYDVAGRRVRTLLDGPIESGRQPLRWDLRDSIGAPAAAGVYILRLSVDGKSASSRVLVMP